VAATGTSTVKTVDGVAAMDTSTVNTVNG
jgi:hypothetical protein